MVSMFKVGERVRVRTGLYTGYPAGSPYNLPREDGYVTESGGEREGYIKVAFPGGVESPPVNPLSFELVAGSGPVRTVTRKEIVPGVYGVVSVKEPYPSASGRVANVCVPPTQASPAELRAAAATFNELADALDEVA